MLAELRSWLDLWRGVGAVERGMAQQGFDLQFTRYDDRGWRATFYTTGMGALADECGKGSAWDQHRGERFKARMRCEVSG